MKLNSIILAILLIALISACGGGGGGGGSSSGDNVNGSGSETAEESGSGGNSGNGSNSGNSIENDDNNENDPTEPVLATIGDRVVTLGGDALTFSLSAEDPNDLMLMYSTDGSVGSGLNPYSETGSMASFNENTGQFTWDVSGVNPGEYFVEFTVMNTNAEEDSETVRITVQSASARFELGQRNYNDNCMSCHGNNGIGGSVGLIQCVNNVSLFEALDGIMSQYANGWSDADKEAVWYFLNHEDNNDTLRPLCM